MMKSSEYPGKYDVRVNNAARFPSQFGSCLSRRRDGNGAVSTTVNMQLFSFINNSMSIFSLHAFKSCFLWLRHVDKPLRNLTEETLKQ